LEGNRSTLPESSDLRITIDLEDDQVIVERATGRAAYRIDTPEAFEAISRAWLRAALERSSPDHEWLAAL